MTLAFGDNQSTGKKTVTFRKPRKVNEKPLRGTNLRSTNSMAITVQEKMFAER